MERRLTRALEDLGLIGAFDRQRIRVHTDGVDLGPIGMREFDHLLRALEAMAEKTSSSARRGNLRIRRMF